MRVVLRLFRLAVVIAIVAALAGQVAHSLDRPGFRLANFFSFFTVQSNIVGAVVLLAFAASSGGGRARSARFEALRGAATLYLAVTGLVVALILRGLQEDLQLTLGWVDFVLHDLSPVAIVADWLVDPPQQRLPRRLAVAWLAYPVAYTVYTLIRGHYVHWYPYPFLDAGVHGVGGVLLRGIPLLAAMLALALVIRELGELRRRQVERAAAS